MLQYSKFVNTKAYEKANPNQNTTPFPIFNKPVVSSSRARRPQVLPEKEPECAQEHMPEAAPAEPESKQFIHASINLEEMQRKEDLSMQEEDWLTFFMGKEKQCELTGIEETAKAKEELLSASFATEYGQQSTIITPLHQTEALLHEEEAVLAPAEISWAQAALEAAKQIAELREAEERETAEAAAKYGSPATAKATEIKTTETAPELSQELMPEPLPPPPLPMPKIDPIKSGQPGNLNEIFDELIKSDRVFQREYKF